SHGPPNQGQEKLGWGMTSPPSSNVAEYGPRGEFASGNVVACSLKTGRVVVSWNADVWFQRSSRTSSTSPTAADVWRRSKPISRGGPPRGDPSQVGCFALPPCPIAVVCPAPAKTKR